MMSDRGGPQLHVEPVLMTMSPPCERSGQCLSCMLRYFGAAKQLPGVKELFEKEAPKQVSRASAAGAHGHPLW